MHWQTAGRACCTAARPAVSLVRPCPGPARPPAGPAAAVPHLLSPPAPSSQPQVGRLEAGAVATHQRIQELEARVDELEQLVEASLEPCGVSSTDQEGE